MRFLFIFNLLLIINLDAYSQKRVIHSNTKKIVYKIDGLINDWRIAPEVNPDVLKVYCEKENNSVFFKTDIDSVEYFISNKDTVNFNIVLKNTDTAYTQLIGIKEIPNSISNHDKVYYLSKIWSEIKYNFVNIDYFSYDLDSIYNEYIIDVMNSKNDYEYYQILKKFLGLLHDGHSEVYDNHQFHVFKDYIPISINDINYKFYITRIRKGIGLDSTFIGAEIIEIDKIPTHEYLIKNIFPFIAASTKQHLWMQASYLIQNGFKSEPFKATVKKIDKTIYEIELKRNGEKTRTKDDQYWGPNKEYSRNIVDLSWQKDSIALININSFYPEEPAINGIIDAIEQTKNAKAIIFDLRQNGGGSTEVAWVLQKYLTSGDYFLNYGWETRISDGVKKANGNWIKEYEDFYLDKAVRYEMPDTVLVEDTINKIKVPVAILIGRYTFSAAEDFLVNLYETPDRPVLIGEETGGSTGSPLVISGLPGDGYARICTRRICYPFSRNRFVNKGVKPDIEIKQTIADYLENKDVVLEKALEIIKTKLIK